MEQNTLRSGEIKRLTAADLAGYEVVGRDAFRREKRPGRRARHQRKDNGGNYMATGRSEDNGRPQK